MHARSRILIEHLIEGLGDHADGSKAEEDGHSPETDVARAEAGREDEDRQLADKQIDKIAREGEEREIAIGFRHLKRGRLIHSEERTDGLPESERNTEKRRKSRGNDHGPDHTSGEESGVAETEFRSCRKDAEGELIAADAGVLFLAYIPVIEEVPQAHEENEKGHEPIETGQVGRLEKGGYRMAEEDGEAHESRSDKEEE